MNKKEVKNERNISIIKRLLLWTGSAPYPFFERVGGVVTSKIRPDGELIECVGCFSATGGGKMSLPQNK